MATRATTMTTRTVSDAAVITLAAFRVTRLVAWDDLTAEPRARLSGMSDAEFHRRVREAEEDQFTAPPARLAVFLHCPWCVGFWMSLAWVAAYDADRERTIRVARPFAVAALVGFAARWLDP